MHTTTEDPDHRLMALMDRRTALGPLLTLPLAACAGGRRPLAPGVEEEGDDPPEAVTANVGTLTAGVITGGGLTIDLDAAGSDPVISHSNFELRADGDASFGGEVSSEFFTSGQSKFSGSLLIGSAYPDPGILISDERISFFDDGDGGATSTIISKVGAGGYLRLSGDDGVQVASTSVSKVGFYGTTPTAKITVAGARDDPEAALADLLSALASLGLITDSTTAT